MRAGATRRSRPAPTRAAAALAAALALTACAGEQSGEAFTAAAAGPAIGAPRAPSADGEPPPAAPTRPPLSIEIADGGASAALHRHGAVGALTFAAAIRDDASGPAGIPVAWSADGDTLAATVRTASAEYAIRLAPDAARPLLAIRVTARYARAVEVAHEELALVFAGAADAAVLDRDMVARPVAPGAHLTDRWTPLEVAFASPIGRARLGRAQGFDTAVTRAAGAGLAVALELDDAGNHPFTPYAECRAQYADDVPRSDLGRTPRAAGDAATAAAVLWVGDELPLRLERLPEGRRAAIVFTSHADQSTPGTTRALLFGHSDEASPEHGRRGFASHGLAMTLAAWAEGGTYTDLSQPEFARLAAEAAAAGIEICPHSPTPRTDDPAQIERLLAAYAPYSPRTWIDHEPETNCEAINGAGLAGGAADVGGALAAAGYRYLWSVPDANPPGGANLLGARIPGYRPALLYRSPRASRPGFAPWLFKSVWRFLDRGPFFAQYADPRLDELVRERGVHVAHVYIDVYKDSGRFAARALVERDGDGFRLRDDAEGLFARLAARQRSGELWVASMRSLGAHLSGIAGIAVEPLGGGAWELRGGDRALHGLTFSVPATGLAILVDGGPPNGMAARGGETAFWLDLEPGAVRRVTIAPAPGGPFTTR